MCGQLIVSDIFFASSFFNKQTFLISNFFKRYFSFITAKEDAEVHACSILLRGASKDVLNEVERNLNDAMFVARNVMRESRLVPGGGAIEMCIAQGSSSFFL